MSTIPLVSQVDNPAPPQTTPRHLRAARTIRPARLIDLTLTWVSFIDPQTTRPASSRIIRRASSLIRPPPSPIRSPSLSWPGTSSSTRVQSSHGTVRGPSTRLRALRRQWVACRCLSPHLSLFVPRRHARSVCQATLVCLSSHVRLCVPRCRPCLLDDPPATLVGIDTLFVHPPWFVCPSVTRP